MRAVLLVENQDGTTTTMHVDAADVVVSQQSPQAQPVYYNPSVLRAVSTVPAAVEITVKATGGAPVIVVQGGVPTNVAFDSETTDYMLTHMPGGREITARELRRLIACAYEDGRRSAHPIYANPVPPISAASVTWSVKPPQTSGAAGSNSFLKVIQDEMNKKYQETFDEATRVVLRDQILASGYAVEKAPPIKGSGT